LIEFLQLNFCQRFEWGDHWLGSINSLPYYPTDKCLYA